MEVAGEVLVLGIANDNISLLSNIKDDERVERIKKSENQKYVSSNVPQKSDRYRSRISPAISENKTFSDHMEEFSGTETANKYSSSEVAMMIRKKRQRMETGS